MKTAEDSEDEGIEAKTAPMATVILLI
jgi:hypothetical protein